MYKPTQKTLESLGFELHYSGDYYEKPFPRLRYGIGEYKKKGTPFEWYLFILTGDGTQDQRINFDIETKKELLTLLKILG